MTGEQERNVDELMVPRAGRVEEVPERPVPYRLVDGSGTELPAVTEFLRDLTACDCSPATATFLCLRAPQLAPVLAGSSCGVGPGDTGRGSRLRALAGTDTQAATATAAGQPAAGIGQPGHREALSRRAPMRRRPAVTPAP